MVDRGLLEKMKKHLDFANSERKHVLLISNHGCHAPSINVTTDTGGQNFYVNGEAEALTKLGYKVTILNRGGYNHPVTGQPQRGIVYYNKVWPSRGKFCRIIYLEDSSKEFVPKEELTERNMAEEAKFFFEIAEEISLKGEDLYFINSHYWDAGVLACMIKKEIEARKGISLPHIWTPIPWVS